MTIRTAGLVTPRLKFDREANMRACEELTAEAAARGAQLVCTPEGFLEGYVVQEEGLTRERYAEMAETLPDGPYILRLRDLARRHSVHICAGFVEREGDALHNSAALIGPDGEIIGRYRKTHLMGSEPLNTPGEEFPVFDTALGRIGMMICFDRQPPEVARILAVKGARLILNPSAGMHGEMNDTMMRTRAYENSVHIIFAHYADCLIISPTGEILARYEEGGDPSSCSGSSRAEPRGDPVVVADLDLSLKADGGLLRHRRPHLYGELAER
jgi:predicted amidohydrolase